MNQGPWDRMGRRKEPAAILETVRPRPTSGAFALSTGPVFGAQIRAISVENGDTSGKRQQRT